MHRIRLDPFGWGVDSAVQEAIDKVAPGHIGYSTALNWKKLYCITWTWPNHDHPGKVGVNETVEGWFRLEGTHLVAQRVLFHGIFEKEGDERHWP